MGLWLYLCTVVGNLTAKEHLSEFCLRLVWRSSCRKIDYALLWAEDNIVRMHTFFASFWTSPHGVPCHVQVFGERHRPLPGHVLAPDAAAPHAHALEVGLREGEVVRVREGGLLYRTRTNFVQWPAAGHYKKIKMVYLSLWIQNGVWPPPPLSYRVIQKIQGG